LEESSEYIRIFKGIYKATETYLSVLVKENPENLSLNAWQQKNADVANHPFPKSSPLLK